LFLIAPSGSKIQPSLRDLFPLRFQPGVETTLKRRAIFAGLSGTTPTAELPKGISVHAAFKPLQGKPLMVEHFRGAELVWPEAT
jgi:hypothetical protein